MQSNDIALFNTGALLCSELKTHMEAYRLLVVYFSFDYQLSSTSVGRFSVQKVSVPLVMERMRNT